MNLFTSLTEILRLINRNRLITFLSISGLAVGLCLSLFIGFWSINEFSFDNFHKDSDRIYRICRQGFINNESVTLGTEFGPVAPFAKEQISDIEDVSRIWVMSHEVAKIKMEVFYEDKICAVDKNLFSFFSFKLEEGDPKTCLDAADKIVIDRYFSDKYFNGENPIGQVVELFGKSFSISAVMENSPENSHVKFHLAIPIESLGWSSDSNWGSNDKYITYLKLRPNTDPVKLSSRITEMTYEHIPFYRQLNVKHFLQPLQKIHLSSGFRFDSVITKDRRTIFILISIALLILVISILNFINLFISSFTLRAKAIGVKKINGSSNRQLFVSVFFETIVYILIASIFAFLVFVGLLPLFNQLVGSNLTVEFTDYRLYVLLGILLAGSVLICVIFPYLYVIRFNPETIIRNRFKGTEVKLVQRVLVVCQFAASIVLVISTIVVKRQIDFIQHKDLGFNIEQVIYFSAKNFSSNYETIRQELKSNPDIIDVTAKSNLPCEWYNGVSFSAADNPLKEEVVEICEVKYNYAEMMNIPLIAGRNPFTASENKTNECLINEQAAINLGLSDPVGKQIKLLGKDAFTIAGVLRNANTKSLHLQVDPQVYFPLKQLQPTQVILMKTSKNVKGAIQTLANLWRNSNPEYPFEYHFLDETYEQLYRTEAIASKIVSVGMIIAIYLALIGLYAISLFSTKRRINEIGIRKVNGAKISEILVLLNRDFVKWVLIAFAISTPIAWYAMHKWLEAFAYKTVLSWWIFAISGVLALGIALLTVSWQSWKAATQNPVEALRYE